MTGGAAWTWLAENPAIWTPVVGAVMSLAYTAIDRTTRGHAVLSFVAAVLPLDLPKMREAAVRIIATEAEQHKGDGQ